MSSVLTAHHESKNRFTSVPSSSLEQIYKFNYYFCSQRLIFFLPPLLSWLKSSQGSLQSLHAALRGVFSILKMLAFVVYACVHVVINEIERRFLSAILYAGMAFIFAQFACCLYLISQTKVPIGLIFLIFCLYIISHINLKVLVFYLNKSEKSAENKRTIKRFTAGEKSISNIKLF